MTVEHPYKLRSIEVRDFKSIEHADIELHPLSIVVGANSSGKSSLLQVILAMSQAVRSRSAGTTFPLNGEYARFGTFDETVRFQVSKNHIPAEDYRRITVQVTISDNDEQGFLRDPETPEESTEERVFIDWVLNLVSDANSDSDTAKIDSVHLRSYERPAPGEPRVLLQYDLDHLGDMEPEDRNLGYRVMAPGGRAFSSQPILTSTDGSYLERDERGDRVTLKCNAVELRGAVPEAVFALSTFSDAVGQHWWNAAKRLVSSPHSNSSASQDEQSSESQPTQSDRQDLEAMVESAARAAKQVREVWTERSDSRRWGPPIAVQLYYLLQEQFDKAVDPQDRHHIERGLENETIMTFLKELANHLASEEWAREQVWSSPDDFFSPGVGWSSFMIHNFFGRDVKYLGPLRKAPQVLYDPRLRDLDLGLSGEYTAAILHANSAHQVIPVTDTEAGRVTLESEVDVWLHRFGLATKAILEDRGRLGIGLQITPIDGSRPVDLTSVGVGVSQLLPVIVLCLLSEPGDLIILEQPELHLHPALQQQLGDFLLDCANSGRQLLVETHSEHLVNRVRRRVADPSRADEGMVGLLFAEQRQGVTRFRQSAINPYGGTESDWPEGFFDVSAKEAQALVSASLTKRYRDPN